MVNDESEISDINTKEIEPIYNGDLDSETIKKKPILKPIAEMNNSHMNFELLINRALYEYTQDKKAIDEMIKINPKYSETIILSKIQSILGYVKQIIHSQNLEKENMKNTINKMIKIAEQDYGLLEEESEEEPRIIKKEEAESKEEPRIIKKEEAESEEEPRIIKKEEAESKEEPRIIKKEEAESEEEDKDSEEENKDKKKEEEPKEFYSDLLEKNIPIPDENEEESIPIPKR